MEGFVRTVILLTAILASVTTVTGRRRAIQTVNGQTTFDVTAYGAAGDGKTDDVKAFESTWKAACEAGTGSVTVVVPGGKNFLVSRAKFEGPCKSSKIIFVIQGNILAPQKNDWKDKSADEWLYFLNVDGLVVDGQREGTVDGRGESWWSEGSSDSDRPAAMRFSGCKHLQVKSLQHKNSPRNHVSLCNCNNADVADLKMEAPEDSPNTDGIDISGSTALNIHDSIMATGDDCIAINGGTSNVNISNISCGPGHGISIGSLGKDGGNDEVSGIQVSDCSFKRTQNGIRIKTWQGGSGFAKDITFSNIEFIESDNPVIIDQYYCPDKECSEQGSAVKISNVKYTGLNGTSTCENGAIILRCSKTVPCDNIKLADVNITPASSHIPNKATCINVHGEANTKNPVVNCLGK